MREYRKPDLKAPRYRTRRKDLLVESFYEAFKEANPKYSYLSNKEIREIVKAVNGKIWNTAIEERDGIELPEQLGYIFIGSCPAPKKENPNFHLSKELNQVIRHRNWESDQYLAKVFYTNSASKYRFQFSKLWGFSAGRSFSRTVAKTYPSNYTKYLLVDDHQKINTIFSKKIYGLKMEEVEKEILNTTYNEFDL